MAKTIEDRALEALRAEMEKGKSGKTATPKEPIGPLVKEVEGVDTSKFKEIFGFEPTMPVEIKDIECPEKLKPFIPEINEDYVFDHEATTVLVYSLQQGLFPNIVGPTGSGKSTMAEQVCARLKWPFFRFNGRGDMETAALFGMMVVRDGATQWVDGTFTTAVKEGATVLMDEWTVVPAEISMALQWLREHGGKLLLTDKPGEMHEKLITPHKNFRLICADNTRGLGDNGDRFAGTQIQNSAFINRFDVTIEHNYMEQKDERKILTNKFPAMEHKAAEFMVKFAALVRTAYEKGDLSVTLSPRNLISWSKKAMDWGNMEKAFKFTYYNMLPTDSERTAVKALYKTVFDKAL